MAIKKIDALGRIVIPKSIRDQMHLTEGTPLFIDYDSVDKKITMHKEDASCAICSSHTNLLEKGGVVLCRNCYFKIKESP